MCVVLKCENACCAPRLSDPIRITSSDTTLFYQPLAAEVQRNGAGTKSVYTLLETALARNDTSRAVST